MLHRILGLTAVTLTLAAAEKTAPPAITAEDLRSLLDANQNPDITKLAEQFSGKKGGNALFYFPSHDEPATPADWGLKYERVDFKSADATPLHGWFVPAKGTVPKAAKATVVFSHGNAGAIGHHLGFCMWLAEAGYNVLLYDYRGFGKSGGAVDRRGMIDDVKAAFTYISKRRDIDTTKLISYGHSLGGAQSITALGETPVKGVRAIIIDGAFASYHAMAKVMGGQLGGSLISDELAPKDYVKKLAPTPFLVVHGALDEVVPVAQGRQLFEAAGEPKTLFEVKKGRHGTALTEDKGAYRKKMIAWLDGVFEK